MDDTNAVSQQVASMVKKNNQLDILKCVVLFVALFIGLLIEKEETFQMALFMGGAIAYGASYFNQYLRVRIYKKEDKKEDLFGYETIVGIMRTQAFAVHEYFSYIRKRFFLWQAILGLEAVILFIVKTDFRILLLGIGIVVFSSLAGWCFQFLFLYRLTHRVPIWLSVLCALGKGCCWIAEVSSLIDLLLAWFLGYAILSDFFCGRWEEQEIVYHVFGGDWIVVVGILTFIIFVSVCLWGSFFAYIVSGKKMILALGILWIAVFAMGILIQANNYVEVTPEEIVSADFSGKKTYSIEDIKEFWVYEEDFSIQLEVEFLDGNHAKLCGGSISTSTAYDETYFSEYNFFAELIPQYLSNGAKGNISDIDTLREGVLEYDPQLSEGLEKIIAVMGERQ